MRHFGGIAQASAKFGNTGIAARAPNVAWGEFVKDFLDDQFVRQGLEDLAAGMQFYDHSLVRGLQAFLCFLLIRDDAQQLCPAILELFLQESASLLRQRRLAYIGALLVGVDLSIERETPSTRKGQHGSGLLFIRDNRRQVSAGRGMPFDCRRDEFFYFPSNSASACLGSFYTVVTDETRHQVATRGASAWLRHAHPITGNSVPQLIPPFLGRRPCRPQLRWYVDSAGNCGARASRAVPVDSFHQSCARQAGHLRSSKAPGPPW